MQTSLNAGLITLSTDASEVAVGDTVEVTLSATGMDMFDVFDLDVLFDTSLFSYNLFSLNSDLPGGFLFENQTPTGLAISFFDLLPYPGGDFTLARFELTALSSGISNFNLTIDEFSLSDPFDIFAPATPLNVTAVSQAQVQVSQVPEPSSVALLLSALALILTRREKS